MLAAAILLVVFVHANRAASVKLYFRAEQAILENWPRAIGKDAVEHFAIYTAVPSLCRAGLLGPARLQVAPGMSFLLDPRDLIAVSILRGAEWQPEIWEALAPALSEGSVFLDVGAHIGYFSMKASPRAGKTGKVLAFEPNPETLKLLRDNVRVNNAANVVVLPVACTSRESQLTFWASASFNTGMSSLSRENADITYKEPPRPYQVRGRRIDDIIREMNLERVDAIKIDVEGAEVEVLRGTRETLRRFHPKLVVEVDARQLAAFKTTPEELAFTIKGAGYNQGAPLNPGGTDWAWTVQ
ncbi:MAG: FkbM family methyltransferase [Acidobacteriota bacterium]|nr:FkbM family methyltransferase [Acidobacteriota bacterium]